MCLFVFGPSLKLLKLHHRTKDMFYIIKTLSFLNFTILIFGCHNFLLKLICYCFFTVPLPCIVGDWSNWSAPDATGSRFRVRYMERPALNGGKECPDLIQLGKGKNIYCLCRFTTRDLH